MPQAKRRTAFYALVCGAIVIGASPVLVRLSEVGPVATACYRVALALPLLWWWARHMPVVAASPIPRGRAGLAFAGVIFAADMATWHWSIKTTTVANATLLANCAPLVVAVGAHLLYGVRYRRSFLFALALGFAGVALVLGDSVAIARERLVGDALGLLTAAFYGAYLLTVSHLRRQYDTATILLWSGAVSAALLLPLAWFSEPELLPRTAVGWSVLLVLSWLVHAGGQGMITYALAHLPAHFSSLTLLLQPIVAALLGAWLFAETLSPLQLIGGVIVLLAIALARSGQGVSTEEKR